MDGDRDRGDSSPCFSSYSDVSFSLCCLQVFTYDLVSAMAVDFFFAYDVIDFLMMLYHDDDVFTTDWMYVCVCVCVSFCLSISV